MDLIRRSLGKSSIYVGKALDRMLSVIIPCYNNASTLAVQLEALAAQQCSEPWEVIISDNGSTDDTWLIAEQYRARLPNLQLIDASDRCGAAYARNVAVRAAKGDKLIFCDADDEVAPGWLAAMSEALATHDFVAGRLDPFKLNEAWVLKTRQCPQQNGLQTYNYPAYLPHAAACNLGVKRAIHEAIGGFDESLLRLHDTDYCWRAQLAGVSLHYAPEALVNYRFRGTLSGIYNQARLWGQYNVLLYKKYRSQGMPELPWRTGLAEWVKLFKKLFRIRSKSALIRWLWRFSWHLGRLQGSLKYRVLAL